MFAPRLVIRRSFAIAIRTPYICPSCQHRAQSSASLPPKPPQNEQSEHILENVPQSPGHDQAAQQNIQQEINWEQLQTPQSVGNHGPLYWYPDPQSIHGVAPMYPQAETKEPPKATGKPGETFDRPFDPSVAAFVTGIALGFAGAAFLYFFSGAYRMVSHSQQERRNLARRRMELFGPRPASVNGSQRQTSFDERRIWFEQVVRSYACFAAGSHAYLAAALPTVERAARIEGKDGRDRVDQIIRECADELKKLAVNGGVDLMGGREAWRIVRKHLEQIVDLAEEGRDVPQEIKERVEKRLAGLRKLGTKVGRDERRAMEQEEMSKAAAASSRR